MARKNDSRDPLEAEESARWERKIQRRVRWSKLGPPVSLDAFDWSARPQLSPQVVKELLTGRFVTYRKAFRRVSQPDLLVLDDCGFDSGKPWRRPRDIHGAPLDEE